MALCYKWGVKIDFILALQFFMLISDGLGGVLTKDLRITVDIPLIKVRNVNACWYNFLLNILRVRIDKDYDNHETKTSELSTTL